MVRGKLVVRMLGVVIASSLLLGAVPTAQRVVAAEVEGQDTPEAAFERYRQLINTHDFEPLAQTVIALDALFVFTEKTHRGLSEVRAAFEQTWSALPDEVYTMTDAQWLTRDTSSALVVFRYSYQGTMKNGQSLSGGGHGTNLYKRTPAGWRLAYEHLSHDPKPAPAS